MKQHPHKEIIIAWANGLEIQYRHNLYMPWEDLPRQHNTWGNPSWDVNTYYRIKENQ